MAKMRYINTKVWQDTWFSDLDATEKLLFLYLITNPNTSICGVYEIPLRQVALDTNIDQEAIKRLFLRFQETGKARYEIGWVIVKNFVKHQTINPKIAKGILTEIEALPAWLGAKVIDSKDECYIDLTIVHDRL